MLTWCAVFDGPGDINRAVSEKLAQPMCKLYSVPYDSRSLTVLVLVHWYMVEGCESDRTATH